LKIDDYELEAYQSLQLDFDTEFSQFLSQPLPQCTSSRENTDQSPANGNDEELYSTAQGNRTENRRRRSSFNNNSALAANFRQAIHYNIDGTISCCDITYSTLCLVSERQTLTNLTTLTIAVSAQNSSDNLSIVAACVPRLTTLKLDNSRITSLRVLGDEMSHLKTLSVCYCGLSDLDGINYAPNVVNLVAPHNAVTDVYPLTELRRIQTVDLGSNSFDSLGSISFLFICPRLENLVLKGNPVSRMEDYRLRVFNMLPNLKNLDVILIARAPRTVCRKEAEDGDNDHDRDSGAPIPIKDVTNQARQEKEEEASNIPRELEGLVEKDPGPIPDKDPMKDEVILKLMHQNSDEKPSQEPKCDESKNEEEDPKTLGIMKDQPPVAVAIFGEKANSPVKNESGRPVVTEDEMSEKSQEFEKSGKNVIKGYSPSFKSGEGGGAHAPKLLKRRESLAPVRLRNKTNDLETEDGGRGEVSEDLASECSTSSTSFSSPPKMDGGTTSRRSSKTSAAAPNLTRLIRQSSSGQASASSSCSRADSSLSSTSSGTVSSLASEADSGIGFTDAKGKGHHHSYQPLPRLKERTGRGCLEEAGAQETPSKRTKHNDKAKLVRTDSNLAGRLQQQGDIEIEDFD